MALSIQEAMEAKSLVYYDCGMPKRIILTGRYLDSGKEILLEYKTSKFSDRSWIKIGLLDIIKEWKCPEI